MIFISCDTDDPVSRFGMKHFIDTTGLSVQPGNTQKSGVCIGYQEDGNGLFSVAIVENNALEEQAGKIVADNQTYPLYQIPIDTSDVGNTCIAEFQSDGMKYPCVSRSSSGIVFGFDIFRLTGSILSGYLDNKDIRYTMPDINSVGSLPVVDFYENLLFQAILTGCGEIGIPLIQKSHWPSGKKFAVCLTHDVDEVKKTYQWITRPMRFIKNGDFDGLKKQMSSLLWKIRGYEPYWTFEEIMQNEQKFGVRSTFYFLSESGEKSLLRPESWHLYGRCHSLQEPHVTELIKELSENGFEIGVHGSTYSYNDLSLINSEKNEIEELLGENVAGIRQHRLNLTVPDTWEYQYEAGFLYDTTLGHKSADGTGFRWGTSFPFHPWSALGMLPLIEIPLCLMDITLQNAIDGWEVCEKTIEQVRTMGGVLTLLWHPAVFNNLEFPNTGDWYWKIIEKCSGENAWITTGQEIAQWWEKRGKMEFECQYGEDKVSIFCDTREDDFYDIYVQENKSPELLSGNARLSEIENGHYILCPDGENLSNEIVVRFV